MAGNQILRVRSHAGQRRSDDSSGPFLSRPALAGWKGLLGRFVDSWIFSSRYLRLGTKLRVCKASE